MIGDNRGNQVNPNVGRVIELDQMLRKNIVELYMSLEKLGDPVKSIELLSEHITVMVEMINDIKGKINR